MTDTTLAVEPPLRRVVRLIDRPADPEPPARRPEPGSGAEPAHDRSRPAHCRIAMQFED
ncbi:MULTISPECIES: hypothetical protein [unclassified Kitasatospora]|uniref:hypothetical protein n=1 Tax=unclassified Kitasatospora TaxID=2633591 RepID=UPI0033D17D67